MVYLKKSMTDVRQKINAPVRTDAASVKTLMRGVWALSDGAFYTLPMFPNEGQVENAAENGGIMNQIATMHRIKARIAMVFNRIEKSIFNGLVTFVILCALWTVILYN